MEKEQKKKSKSELVEILPLKDFVIHQNEFHYELKAGEKISIHERFIENLKTEKVIN